MNLLSNRKTISEDTKKKLYEEFDKPVQIQNLVQLREMLSVILEVLEKKEINLSVEVKWTEDNKQKIETVKGVSKDTSMYDLLVNGMEVVKNRQESMSKISKAVNDAKEIDPDISSNLNIWNVNSIRFNVDNLIEHKMGGKRDGLKIKWKLPEGIFEFDPYSKKLFKVDDESGSDQVKFTPNSL